MASWRRVLAVLGGVTAVAVLFAELFYPYNKDVGQIVWSWIVDPAVVIVMGLIVLVNVRASLRIRGGSGDHRAQMPRDVITTLVAIVWVRFLLQYADQIAPDHDATSGLWGHLSALAIVILTFEAIVLWRSSKRGSAGGSGSN